MIGHPENRYWTAHATVETQSPHAISHLWLIMHRFSPFLKSAAVIRYVAIALIATGVYEHSDARIMIGIGLLVPTKIEQVDEKLDKISKKSVTESP
jgi:hypothetical protein